MKILYALVVALIMGMASPGASVAEESAHDHGAGDAVVGELGGGAGAKGRMAGGKGKGGGPKGGQAGEKPLRCAGLVNMSNGMVLPVGKYSVSLKYVHVSKDKLYDGQDRKTGNYNGKYKRVDNVVNLTAKAGLFDDFEARIQVPLINREQKQKSGNPPAHSATVRNSGFGDPIIMGRYALLSERNGDPFSLAVGAGVKVPLSNTDKKTPPGGASSAEYMGPNFQLSTGSWDPKMEIGATKMLGRSRVDAHFMYTIAGDGAHDSRGGNQFKYDFGYGYALNKYFDLEIELNGVDQQPVTHNGEKTVNTGGHFIFITPGVHWKITDSTRLAVGVPVVVYRNLRGEPRTPERSSKFNLGEDYRIVTSLSYHF
ncbi:hypothetical protein GKC30_01300 [Pseudodesulfovibrio sp. F-1]|uniref:Transporter n=1 Tax=Pseudodesulfovibrio alkaliphilus TaxID=2661613 RepID=A0A7K1KJL4_9BACT|nr:hypothetical protein [Pseudodesulfovibrio alkaliphilus]